MTMVFHGTQLLPLFNGPPPGTRLPTLRFDVVFEPPEAPLDTLSDHARGIAHFFDCPAWFIFQMQHDF